MACRWRRRQGYYTQMNKGCVWLILVETVSGGEQSSGHKHWEGESYGGHFLCTHFNIHPWALSSPWIPPGEGFTTPTGMRHWSPWHGCAHANSVLNRTSFPRGFPYSPQIDYQEKCVPTFPHPQRSSSDRFCTWKRYYWGRSPWPLQWYIVKCACLPFHVLSLNFFPKTKMWHQVIDTLAMCDSNFSPHIQ